MTLEIYYRMINSGAGRKLKEILNGLVPGLIPEPVPVRVPVRRPEQRERRRYRCGRLRTVRSIRIEGKKSAYKNAKGGTGCLRRCTESGSQPRHCIFH